MSEMTEIFDPGDYMYVRDINQRIWVYVVRHDGAVLLVSAPQVEDGGG